ncbi:MAG: hypothetical protein VKJ09_13690 [Leptolyngbya sp.]|nr:hypothetical protein [Leptolyngbya sp.]
MVPVPHDRPVNIAQLVQAAVQTRALSRSQHLYLTSAMLANPTMSASDRRSINYLLDYVRRGKVSLVD